jgi:hypothetical protein
VTRGQRLSSSCRASLLAVLVGCAPGCTLFDDILPGTPFTPDQPVAEVTVSGKINVDPTSASSEGCPAGGALFWGTARNTGDLDVDDVFIEIVALDANNAELGRFRTNVYNGEVSESPPPPAPPEPQVAGTSLAVDQSGSFSVCTRVPYGAVAATAYTTDYIVVSEIE